MSMMFNSQETQQESQQQERRYDPETLRKVTALATRLQNDHHETLTASQMEAIGAEVGLKPEFIQQAIAQLEDEHARAQEQAQQQQQAEQQRVEEQQALQQRRVQEHATRTHTVRQTGTTTATKAEFYTVCAALAAPMLFGLMAYYFKSGTINTGVWGQSIVYPRNNAMGIFTLVAPAPLALLQGFAVGKRRVGFIAAATLILALAPTVPFLAAASPEQYQDILRNLMSHVGDMFSYAMVGIPVVGTLGVAGAWTRQRLFPRLPAGTKENADEIKTEKPIQHREYAVSRPEMVSLLTNMQTGTMQAGVKSRRACLSLDVAGINEMRQSATLVAVDYSFGQFRAWVDETVRGCGGELSAGEGGSLLATFPTDVQAVRAARILQERLPQFNQSLNRLPMPFRLRCGLSAGDAGANRVEERSQSLLRMAEPGDTLVSSEMGASALSELGQLSPLPAALMASDMAFVWHPAQNGTNAAPAPH